MAEFLGLKKEALIQKCKELNLPHEGRGTEQMRSSLIQNAVDAAKRERERKYLEFLREKHRENRDREIEKRKVEAEIKNKELEEAKAYKIKKMEIETRLRDVELQLQEVRAERLQMERRRLKLEEERKERNPDFRHEFPQVEPAGPENKFLGVMTTSAVDTFTGQQNSPTPANVKENSKLMETEKNVGSLMPQEERSIERLHVSMIVYLAKVKAEEKASYEEFLKYQLETAREKTAELPQHPGVTVTSNKPVLEVTTTEVTVEVETEKEVSEISLQSPANEQASADLSIVSKELEHAYAEEISIATQLDTKRTVEVSGIGTENSKVNLTDPVKENPEKLQSETILLGEDVEAKESRAQITVLKEDIALQQEQKEICTVVPEASFDPKEDKDFANECQLCQSTTETVEMIEQLIDQRPKKAQLVKLFPDRGNNKTEQHSREDQSQDGCSPAVPHNREDDDLSPRDRHPRDDRSPADGQPRDDINLKEDIT